MARCPSIERPEESFEKARRIDRDGDLVRAVRRRRPRGPASRASAESDSDRAPIEAADAGLEDRDGRERVVATSGPKVIFTGAPGELTLFMAGRKENVEVTHEGDHAAVAIVLAADFGV